MQEERLRVTCAKELKFKPRRCWTNNMIGATTRVHRRRSTLYYYQDDAASFHIKDDDSVEYSNVDNDDYDESPHLTFERDTESITLGERQLSPRVNENYNKPLSSCLAFMTDEEKRRNDYDDYDGLSSSSCAVSSWAATGSMFLLPDMATITTCGDHNWEVLSDGIGSILSLDTMSPLLYISYADAVRRQSIVGDGVSTSSWTTPTATTTPKTTSSGPHVLLFDALSILSSDDGDGSSVVNDITVCSDDSSSVREDLALVSQLTMGTPNRLDPFRSASMIGEEKTVHRGRIGGRRPDGKLRWKRY